MIIDKKQVIQFLKERKRGVYPLLVRMYVEVISTVGPMMALDIIRQDMQKETSESIDINYTSLAHAIKKYTRKSNMNKKSEGVSEATRFLDAHEIAEKQLKLGNFRLKQVKASNSIEPK